MTITSGDDVVTPRQGRRRRNRVAEAGKTNVVGAVGVVCFFLGTSRAAAAEGAPVDPAEVACADGYKALIGLRPEGVRLDKALQASLKAIEDAIACDKPPAAAGEAGARGPTEPDRSGQKLIEDVQNSGFRKRVLPDDLMTSVYKSSSIDGKTNVVDKTLAVRTSTIEKPDAGIGLLAHEFTHVVNAPHTAPLILAYDKEREELHERLKSDAEAQRKAEEEHAKWDKRGWVYKNIMHRNEKPDPVPVFADPASLPEPPAKEALRLASIQEEKDAFTRAREISRQLGVPCRNGNSNHISSRVPPDPSCAPFDDAELDAQLKQSSGYRALFSPTWNNDTFFNAPVRPRYSSQRDADPVATVAGVFSSQPDADGIIRGAPRSAPGSVDAEGVYTVTWEDIDPAASARELFAFSADTDPDGIIEGVPPTEPGTTDENGIYTVTWGDIAPNRTVNEVFNAQNDADGIIEGVPATEPGTTDENGVYTVTWEDIDPDRAVAEVFNAQGDEDGIIEGVPESEPGTTDENGVYTVKWEDIAADVQADTGFTAQTDEVAHEEGITDGEPASEAGTTADNGVHTVEWTDIDPAQSVTEVFNAEGDADGVIEGEPAAVPGTTDDEGVYTVTWEDIADDVAAETGFAAEPDAAPVEGVSTGAPITEAGSTDADGVRTVTWDEIAP